MAPKNFSRALLLTTAAFAVFLTGCLHEEAALGSPDALEISNTSDDPRINFLTNELGVAKQRISRLMDPIDKDTGYIIEPVISEKARSMGARGTGVGFKGKYLDAMMKKYYNEQIEGRGTSLVDSSLLLESTTSSITDASQSKALGKKSHTRWDHVDNYGDVKLLREVHQVKVYITPTGPARLGPNWTAAVRSAISNWNAQAKGTAMSFVETSSATDHDLAFRGSFGIGDDMGLTSSAFIVPGPYVDTTISLWVNIGYENNATPHNQKTTIAMSLLALATNITFTDMVGFYWGGGTTIHIPGTPVYDGDGWTPGSSILTNITTSNSTPVMTAGDLRTFQTLYPTHGETMLTNWKALVATTYEGWHNVDMNVKTFHTAGDTLIYLRTDGKIFRRIKLTGSNIQIWPASGSSGSAADFLFSKGYLAVRNTAGKLYSRTPTGSWIAQNSTVTYGPSSYRLDGNRLTTVVPNGGGLTLRTFYLGGSGPVAPVLDWDSPSGTMTDWQVKNGLLVVVDGGDVWAMQNYQGWVHLHSNISGHAHSIRLSDQLMALYYTPIGSSDGSVAIRHGGLGGWWSYYTDPVYSIDDIDVCGDKMAFLQQTRYLRTIDYATWTVSEHYTWTAYNDVRKVALMGANCDYIGVIDHETTYSSKYGISMDTPYSMAQGGIIRLSQKSMPIYVP